MVKGIILSPDELKMAIEQAFVAGAKAVEQASIPEPQKSDIIYAKFGQNGRSTREEQELIEQHVAQRIAEIQVEVRHDIFDQLMGGWSKTI